MKPGLVGRIVIAGAFVVAFMVVELALFLDSSARSRDAAAAQRRAQDTLLAATRVGADLAVLEASQRGYVLSGDVRFLLTWREARIQLPLLESGLRQSAVGPDAAKARQITADAETYVRTWAEPLMQLAQRDRTAARARAGGDARNARVLAIRANVQALSSSAATVAEAKRREVQADERRDVVLGVAGVGGTVVLFALIIAYFLRSAVWPLRRLAAATDRVARGELATRVPEGGAGEVGQLARTFNAMAGSLQRSRLELEQLVNVNRAVLDSTVDGICLTDGDGNIVLSNRPLVQFVRELGLPEEGTVPERLLAVGGRFTDPERYRAAIRRIASDPDEATVDEFEFADTHRCFQGFTAPVHGDQGERLGRVWTLREVTAERQADRAKDEFVATVSHELRTPLTSIVGFIEMLLDEDAGSLTDEQRQYLEIVQRSSQRLMRQVGDLLFMARLDEAGLTLHPQEVSLTGLVGECVESHGAVARQRSIDLGFRGGELPAVRGDPERLTQVTANLLSNALKFTPEGGRVSVRTFRDDGRAVLEVEDTGIGIPEEERPRLFERFFRSSAATRQAVQGTGLGLAISKAIVEAHGGSIGVASGSDGGTLFRIELPL